MDQEQGLLPIPQGACKKGQVIGGLGVSGGSEEQDAALAAFGADFFARLVKNAYL